MVLRIKKEVPDRSEWFGEEHFSALFKWTGNTYSG